MHTNNEAPLCNVTTTIIIKIKIKYHRDIIHQVKNKSIISQSHPSNLKFEVASNNQFKVNFINLHHNEWMLIQKA